MVNGELSVVNLLTYFIEKVKCIVALIFHTGIQRKNKKKHFPNLLFRVLLYTCSCYCVHFLYVLTEALLFIVQTYTQEKNGSDKD